jgi:hypothetical protein
MAYVFPTSVCVVRHGEGRVHLNPDQQWDADDPFVKARPDLFTENPLNVQRTVAEPPVERATRAPGEKRTTRGPGKTASGKAAGDKGSAAGD